MLKPPAQFQVQLQLSQGDGVAIVPQLRLLPPGIWHRLPSTTGRLGVTRAIGIVGVGTVGVTSMAEGNEGGSSCCRDWVGIRLGFHVDFRPLLGHLE